MGEGTLSSEGSGDRRETLAVEKEEKEPFKISHIII